MDAAEACFWPAFPCFRAKFAETSKNMQKRVDIRCPVWYYSEAPYGKRLAKAGGEKPESRMGP